MRAQPPVIGHNGLTMARRRHTPDQILKKLRDADVLLSQGLPLAEIAKRLEVSEQRYNRKLWMVI
jgi:DNA-binding transcriptional MerR regulator